MSTEESKSWWMDSSSTHNLLVRAYSVMDSRFWPKHRHPRRGDNAVIIPCTVLYRHYLRVFAASLRPPAATNLVVLLLSLFSSAFFVLAIHSLKLILFVRVLNGLCCPGAGLKPKFHNPIQSKYRLGTEMCCNGVSKHLELVEGTQLSVSFDRTLTPLVC